MLDGWNPLSAPKGAQVDQADMDREIKDFLQNKRRLFNKRRLLERETEETFPILQIKSEGKEKEK